MDFPLPFLPADTQMGQLDRFATPWLLASVRVFIGGRIFLGGIIGSMPAVTSLSLTFARLAGGVRVSLWKDQGQPALAESAT